MNATASSHLNASTLKPIATPARPNGTSSTSVMRRIDALEVGGSRSTFTLRLFVVLGFGSLVFAIAQLLGII